jgi:hypothetical protein
MSCCVHFLLMSHYKEEGSDKESLLGALTLLTAHGMKHACIKSDVNTLAMQKEAAARDKIEAENAARRQALAMVEDSARERMREVSRLTDKVLDELADIVCTDRQLYSALTGRVFYALTGRAPDCQKIFTHHTCQHITHTCPHIFYMSAHLLHVRTSAGVD